MNEDGERDKLTVDASYDDSTGHCWNITVRINGTVMREDIEATIQALYAAGIPVRAAPRPAVPAAANIRPPVPGGATPRLWPQVARRLMQDPPGEAVTEQIPAVRDEPRRP